MTTEEVLEGRLKKAMINGMPLTAEMIKQQIKDLKEKNDTDKIHTN